MNDDAARNKAFAVRLRQIMVEREFKQSDLAAEIWGRTVNTEGKNIAKGRDRISVWVSGRNFPGKEDLKKLANVLKVKVTDLTSESNE